MKFIRNAAMLVMLMLAACGGGGHGDGNGGGDGGGVGQTDCQAAFSPEKLAAGEDCTPVAGSLCPVADSENLLQPQPIPCDGVDVQEFSVTASGLTSSYYALTGGEQNYDAVYVGLHYLGIDKGAFANIVRLPELAKGRKVLVIAPQAPTANRWPTGNALDSAQIASNVEWVKAVVADARSRYHVQDSVPLYVAGLSDGAEFSYLYGCSDPNVRAILATASAANPSSFSAACTSAHQVGTVMVHGTSDITTPYNGLPLGLTMPIPEIHQAFKTIDGCSAADSTIPVPMTLDSFQVTIDYTAKGGCSSGGRNFLVVVDGGGHNWPGKSRGLITTEVLYGGQTENFDATLQGYDLLRLAAGD
ncbi:alpha/beta hydrolase family esterase [Solimonas terrae]|uniref:Plasmid partitioning protein n=1 Tax=Solimonas terrae TaxID=1396819 RepID=A0A6M2BV34_9GAMM|nr:hypothetical protein [Solimonas terrae]NGY06348.1 hypothetical protein [Solimonas terrae]